MQNILAESRTAPRSSVFLFNKPKRLSPEGSLDLLLKQLWLISWTFLCVYSFILLTLEQSVSEYRRRFNRD